MRKIVYLFAMVAIMVLPACEGPAGPEGPPGVAGVDGEDGEPGLSLLNLVVEAEVDFTEENNFSAGFDFEIGDADNLLVFMLWNVIEDKPLWRPLPNTVFLADGITLSYNYQYTADFFSVFMTANTNLTEIPEDWTLNHYLRIVYLPGDFLQSNAKIDLNDYEAVTSALGVSEADVLKLD
ncbi:hypothetical protein [uncultured Cyclobacterium sp.]|uniref:hypothetical protein n=1 Tax=uncultured Cyclobacterium sp. TaxID=453820 RepID=UPI0030EECB10|tara:strand:- start:214531 stop:215070 length:540 start_codon:yes stop_codon:yes gene_type:complete